MKTKRVKAIKSGLVHSDFIGECYILPADPESYERMVEQLAHAIDPNAKELCEHFERRMRLGSSEPWYDYRIEADGKARAALKAIGITQTRKVKGSK